MSKERMDELVPIRTCSYRMVNRKLMKKRRQGKTMHSLGVGLVLRQHRWLHIYVVALERVAYRRQARVRVRLGVDRRHVAIVRVHARQQLAAASDDIADLHLTLDLSAAVTA